MATLKYDAIVIGTGQAGPSLAVRLAASGGKTAVLERKRFGGTCVNVGCIPTKTLVASARGTPSHSYLFLKQTPDVWKGYRVIQQLFSK